MRIAVPTRWLVRLQPHFYGRRVFRPSGRKTLNSYTLADLSLLIGSACIASGLPTIHEVRWRTENGKSSSVLGAFLAYDQDRSNIAQ